MSDRARPGTTRRGIRGKTSYLGGRAAALAGGAGPGLEVVAPFCADEEDEESVVGSSRSAGKPRYYE
jgi:hypothetical protein